jgi:hypothetical protein
LAAVSILFVLSGCGSTPSHFSMYPEAIEEDRNVDEATAILLVGNAGPASIDYLQFVHSSLPAINARNIMVPPNGVIAIPIPVGIKSLEFNSYTLAGRSGGYLPSGMSVGYIPVHTPRIDITSRGLYYVATLFPGSPDKYSVEPNAVMLAQFRRTHPQLANLKPINFVWPK